MIVDDPTKVFCVITFNEKILPQVPYLCLNKQRCIIMGGK